MKTFYCTVSLGSGWNREESRRENVLHISSLQTVGGGTLEAQTLEDFERIIKEHSVDKVMYYFGGFPRRGTTAEKAIPHIKRLIRAYKEPLRLTDATEPVQTKVDLSDLIAD